MPASSSHNGSTQHITVTTAAAIRLPATTGGPGDAGHERDRRRHSQEDGLVGVGEMGLQHEARRQHQPGQRPRLPDHVAAASHSRHHIGQHEGELLASLDQHQAAFVELDQHGRYHRPDTPIVPKSRRLTSHTPTIAAMFVAATPSAVPQ